MRRAWVTPSPAESGDTICIRMTIPAGDVYAAAFRGALLPLCDSANWEQTDPDGEYPEVAAEFFRTLWLTEWEPWEANCEMVNPVGEVFAWAGSAAPTNSLACDGSEVSQSTYPDLYAILGTIWGSAGAGNFRLPDLRSRMPVGAGQGSGLSAYSVADAGGEEAHTLVDAELPGTAFDLDHHHGLSMLEYVVDVATTGAAMRLKQSANPGTPVTEVTDDTAGLELGFGGDTAHENRPPYAAVLFCIWALP